MQTPRKTDELKNASVLKLISKLLILIINQYKLLKKAVVCR